MALLFLLSDTWCTSAAAAGSSRGAAVGTSAPSAAHDASEPAQPPPPLPRGVFTPRAASDAPPHSADITESADDVDDVFPLPDGDDPVEAARDEEKQPVHGFLHLYLASQQEKIEKQIGLHGLPDCYRLGNTFWVRPDDPFFSLRKAAEAPSGPDPSCLYEPEIFVWLPTLLMPKDFVLHCPLCKKAGLPAGQIKPLTGNGMFHTLRGKSTAEESYQDGTRLLLAVSSDSRSVIT